MNRRSFLKTTAAATGVLGFPTIVPSAAFGAGKKISVGCIGIGRLSGVGVGGQGGRDMRNFLSLDGDCHVVAVCDPYRDRRDGAKQIVDEKYGHKGCAAYGDFRDLLARPDIDAVTIATQDHWHALIATAAAAAGKDIFLEKPLGVAVEQGQKIRDAVRRHRRVFQAGTQQRSVGKFRQACELVRNGYLGRLQEIRVVAPGATYQPRYDGPFDPQAVPEGFDWAMWRGPAPDRAYNPGRVAHPDWYLQWDYCAGFICNWGVHYLDVAVWGAPELGTQDFAVECRGSYRSKGFADNIESWNATFSFPGGLCLKFYDRPETDRETGTKFIGDAGWLHVSRAGIWAEPASLLDVKPHDRWVRLASWDDPASDFKMGKAKGRDVPVFTSVNHAQNFLDATRSRRDPLSNVEATHAATNLGLIPEIAARLETRLTWDAKRERFVGDDDANARLQRPLYNGWKLT